ncbi:hypothetical protein Hanom_Chr03g00260501 [Helianthus anomalus]
MNFLILTYVSTQTIINKYNVGLIFLVLHPHPKYPISNSDTCLNTVQPRLNPADLTRDPTLASLTQHLTQYQPLHNSVQHHHQTTATPLATLGSCSQSSSTTVTDFPVTNRLPGDVSLTSFSVTGSLTGTSILTSTRFLLSSNDVVSISSALGPGSATGSTGDRQSGQVE